MQFETPPGRQGQVDFGTSAFLRSPSRPGNLYASRSRARWSDGIVGFRPAGGASGKTRPFSGRRTTGRRGIAACRPARRFRRSAGARAPRLTPGNCGQPPEGWRSRTARRCAGCSSPGPGSGPWRARSAASRTGTDAPPWHEPTPCAAPRLLRPLPAPTGPDAGASPDASPSAARRPAPGSPRACPLPVAGVPQNPPPRLRAAARAVSMSDTFAAVVARPRVGPDPSSTPMCAFVPKCRCRPLRVRCISGSRFPDAFLVEDGASTRNASTTVPSEGGDPARPGARRSPAAAPRPDPSTPAAGGTAGSSRPGAAPTAEDPRGDAPTPPRTADPPSPDRPRCRTAARSEPEASSPAGTDAGTTGLPLKFRPRSSSSSRGQTWTDLDRPDFRPTVVCEIADAGPLAMAVAERRAGLIGLGQ